jgi:hypothetical protein
MTALPSWIPQETWDAFVEMRKKTLKKPPTDFALNLILRELFKLRDLGHDPLACLEQSIVNGWADVYALKAKKSERQAVSAYAENQAALKAEEVRARGIQRDELSENARKIREKFGRKPPTQGELH